MFSIIGAAGLWSIQHWGHRDELQEAAKAAVKSALKVGNRNRRLSSSSDRHSASVDSSKSSHQQHQGRSCNVRDGAFVCFKDRTGQVAVIQPYGNGGSWQLAVTCASGGCCLLPEGAGTLSHLSSDAVFLVRQVGNNFAFCSPGAEGRYLSAARDLNVPPVLDSTKVSPSAQWKVSSQGITNVQHPHKKLAFSVCEVKLVPFESITAVERSIADFNRTQQDQVSAAEAASRALQAQLQQSARLLTQTTAEYDDQVQQLKSQLGEACHFNTQLTGLIENKDEKLNILKDHFSQIKTKYQEAERELSTAYTEVATLQQQLAERDEDVHNLQQRMCNETKQWNQLRAALQDSLQAKDEEIAGLSLQVQRMEHALRAVEHTLYGMRKPRRLDRASLDAVSIHQLQAAVDNFAAVGEGVLMMGPDDVPMSTQEAEALRVLLEQQSAGGLELSGFDLEPGTELSLQDLDRIDQGSPDKHRAAAAEAAADAKPSKSPTRTAAAAGARSGRVSLPDAGRPHGRGANWSAGPAVSAAGRELLPTWGLSDDTTLTSSRGARSSATSEGRHRYAGDASDGESQDGEDPAAQQHQLNGEASAAGDDGELDAMCTSMDEDELQQQLGRLKLSASQFSERASTSRTSGSKQQQVTDVAVAGQGPLHAKRPAVGVAAATTSSSRPYSSLTQLSPVKEEQIGHHRSKSSAGTSSSGKL